MRLASIDMGTNTIRLLIAEKLVCRADLSAVPTAQVDDTGRKVNGSFQTLYHESRIARIGEGFGLSSKINSAALERTKLILNDYSKIINNHNIDKTFIVATSAVREAENRDWFLKNLHDVGFDIDVIDAHKEASLTHLGIVHNLGSIIHDKTWAAFDLGGGSTEFMFSRGTDLKSSFSIPLGAVKLFEQFIKTDPPSMQNLNAAADYFMEKLRKKLRHEKSFLKPEIIIGNAGTVTSLAAIDMGMETYSYKETEGYLLKKDRIKEILNNLISLKSGDRLEHFKILEKGREDVITVGANVVLGILSFFQKDYLITTNGSLREGVLIDKFY